MLLTWLPPVEVAPTIGLPPLLPVPRSNARPPAINPACPSPRRTHHAQGEAQAWKNRIGGRRNTPRVENRTGERRNEGWWKVKSVQVRGQPLNPSPPEPDALRPGLGAVTE